VGRAPQAWSHGLGLGGVRKRVRLLGGEVLWRENGERGIACVVTIPGFAGAGTPAGTPGGTMAEP
jgi:signal transduction histidine kinase